VDGPPLVFLRELAEGSPKFLETVYAACVGYPAGGGVKAVADYLAEHDRGTTALYVGMPGLTRDQIDKDARLRAAVEDELDANRANYVGGSPEECRRRLQEFVRGREDLGWAETPVPVLTRVRYRWKLLIPPALIGLAAAGGVVWAEVSVDDEPVVAAVVVAAVAAAAVAALAYVAWLRRRERQDKQIDETPPLDRLNKLAGREDLQLQNHLVSVSVAKPGGLRILTLRAVLAAIKLLARYVATRGDLGGIVTIHFARWVILPRPGKPARLLFLSNYDGSWENYLGEFIDRASNGLTAVWSNTGLGPGRGFPDTRWLFLRGGSRDEQRFKSIVRLSQRTADVWYNAYPGLSVKQIKNNAAFRAGLFGPVEDVREWLRRV
jgi:hypothetical protein